MLILKAFKQFCRNICTFEPHNTFFMRAKRQEINTTIPNGGVIYCWIKKIDALDQKKSTYKDI